MIFAARRFYADVCASKSLFFDLKFVRFWGKRARLLRARAQGETAFPAFALRPSVSSEPRAHRMLTHHPFLEKTNVPGRFGCRLPAPGPGVSLRDKVMGRGQISGAFRV